MKLHPQQEIVIGPMGVIRFRENKIISYLQRSGKLNLNEIARMNFPREDRIQLAQLIGYSVSGFGDLSYVPRKLAGACDAQADKLLRKKKGRKK